MRTFAYQIIPGDIVVGTYSDDRFMPYEYFSMAIDVVNKKDHVTRIQFLVSELDSTTIRKKVFLKDSELEITR
jgi:hypothetical protein